MLQSELERFVMEDLGEWDDSCSILPQMDAEALILAKEQCVISGLAEARQILEYFGLEWVLFAAEGEEVEAGSKIMMIKGQAKSILQAERLVLNFLSRMSGISTLTRDCVRRAKGIRVACTRKTTPGFRIFEKRAVMVGGGDPHRFNQSGALMIKDNHLKLMGLENVVRAAKTKSSFTKKIEVEVESLEDMLKAAELGADIIMFDNMKSSQIKEGIELLKSKKLRAGLILEASGGITPEKIADYASTGVDVISLGYLTRMAKWIDFSLEIERCL
ncbi:MAG: carboxylating nicotinate-nucleotide diphosphorylase [Methanotrichaceae archaeon]